MKNLLLLAVFSLVFISANAQIKVNSSNYVGIRTSSPTHYFDLNSPESWFHYSSHQPLVIAHWGTDPRIESGTRVVFYKTDGSGFIDIQCKTLYEYSDSTAKENITALNSNLSRDSTQILRKIMKLKGVDFNWKNDKTKKVHSGFLAQEVEKVIPEAVLKNDSSQHVSLAYTAIIPYLVEAIKEQQAQIEELKKQVTK
ncbi:MAG TPA: tail fiber domain-containing protein [Sunxiuqinia sp.]|nr:tail fiber domain-containing protein [Sunxiuqinia sp.]